MYAMRCTTVAPVEAGSHVGCQRQLPGTVDIDDDSGVEGAEVEEYQRRMTLRIVHFFH